MVKRERSIVMSVSVACLSVSVCLSFGKYVFEPTRSVFTKFLCSEHVMCGSDSDLLWRLCDTFLPFGYMHHVILAYNGQE